MTRTCARISGSSHSKWLFCDMSSVHDSIWESTGCKYPPAEPGALGIGPLEAATLDPKLYLFSRRTKYSRPRHPDLSSNFFCATSENRCLLIFASPLDGLRSHDCPSSNFLSCAWWLTIGGFGDGRPPQMSNLYCLPGRAGGSPGYASGNKLCRNE